MTTAPSIDIEPEMKRIVGRLFRLSPESIQPGFRFVEDLGADSYDAVELQLAVSQAFDVTVTDADVPRLRTVGDLVEHVRRQQPGR
ncbi:MAG: acyl carrier protein [Deltaproteobacteria bacterium]|nr:acyl carrier protein [Deltaproteobacteria bacterium]